MEKARLHVAFVNHLAFHLSVILLKCKVLPYPTHILCEIDKDIGRPPVSSIRIAALAHMLPTLLKQNEHFGSLQNVGIICSHNLRMLHAHMIAHPALLSFFFNPRVQNVDLNS